MKLEGIDEPYHDCIRFFRAESHTKRLRSVEDTQFQSFSERFFRGNREIHS